jgi:hypothetical protein
MRRVKLADVVEACRAEPYATSTWVSDKPTPLLVDGRLWGPHLDTCEKVRRGAGGAMRPRCFCAEDRSKILAAMASRTDLGWLLPVHPDDLGRCSEWFDYDPDAADPWLPIPNVVLALMVSGANDLDGSVLSCSYCSWDTEIATDPGTQPTCLDCRREAESSDEAIDRFKALPNATAFLWDGTEPLADAIEAGLIREGDTVVYAGSCRHSTECVCLIKIETREAAKAHGVRWEEPT